jgi:hypothetical protein
LNGESPKAQTASDADIPLLQEATIPEPNANAKEASLLGALQELVSLLRKKRVLTEEEVELVRNKMTE